jgi:hypothetical protein
MVLILYISYSSEKMVSRGKKTRKNKGGKVLSIPEIRKAFHQVEAFLSKKMRSGMTKMDDLVKSFRSEWRRLFGKTLSVATAKSYINNMREKLMGKRPFRGGAHQQLIMAPLDHSMQPGAYGPHGAYPAYVSGGFQVPEPGMRSVGGISAPATINPNISQRSQTGGRRRKTRKHGRRQGGGGNFLTGFPLAAAFRPFIAETPSTSQALVQDAYKALPPVASSEPSSVAFDYKMPPVIGKIPGIDVAGLNRTLTQDIRVPY